MTLPIPSKPAIRPKVLTLPDALLILVLLGAAIAALPFLTSHKGATAVVFRDNTIVAKYPLSDSTEFTVRGKDGDVRIAIRDNSIKVIESNCPRGVCISAGAIRIKGQQIVCAPNHILIELETAQESGVDGVTQ